jgi:hypothetical protein
VHHRLAAAHKALAGKGSEKKALRAKKLFHVFCKKQMAPCGAI